MGIPTLTLDTNLLHEYWKQRPKSEVIEKLLLLAKQGEIDLAVTARIHEDIPKPPLAERLNELPELGITKAGSVTRVGYGVVGRDMVGDDAFGSFFSSAREIAKQSKKKPPDWRDWDHLHARYLLRREIFLTWDEGITCLAETLNAHFGIVVMKPEEFTRPYSQERI
jgi:hypothetical protein